MTARRALKVRAARQPSDDGFSLIEVVLAVGLIFSVVIMLTYSGVLALVDVAHSRQRQGATGLANEALEQLRALPFATVALGLVTTDIDTMSDPNIVRTGAAAPFTYTYRGERIPHGTHASTPPLLPHRQTVRLEQTTYTVSTYVTHYRNNATNNTLRATTEVTWADPMRKGVPPKVEAQTVLHPGGGCQSTVTHPYSGPCLAFFNAVAQGQPGSVSITGWFLDEQADGTDVQVEVDAKLLLPVQRSTLKLEQVAQLQSVAETSGVMHNLAGVEVKEGRRAISVGADSDPSTTNGATDSDTSQGQGATSLSSGATNTLTLTTSSGDEATGATSATVNSSAGCALGYEIENDQQPCGRGASRQPSIMDAVLRLTVPVPLTMTLASVSSDVAGEPAAHLAGFVDREAPGEVGCSGTTDGCVRAHATRTIRSLELGGLPSEAAPAGWPGWLVRLGGLNEVVDARAGRGVDGPSATRGGGVTWWEDAGTTTTVDFDAGATAGTIEHTFTSPTDRSVRVTSTVDLDVGAAEAASSVPCVTGCDLVEASATVASPLTGDVTYTVTVGSTVVAELRITVDLGSVTAKSTYKAATTGA